MDKNNTIVGEILDDVGIRVTGVSILWAVVPGSIATLLFIIILLTMFRNPSVQELRQNCESEINPYQEKNKILLKTKECWNETSKKKSEKWKLLFIPLSIAFGMTVGKGVYMLALANSNRKVSAGLAGAYVMKSIWNM
jgi:hypothetical protein